MIVASWFMPTTVTTVEIFLFGVAFTTLGWLGWWRVNRCRWTIPNTTPEEGE